MHYLYPDAARKKNGQPQEYKTQQPAWLEEFYNASYEYRISHITGDGDPEQEIASIEGKRVNAPYRLYEKDISPDGAQVWTELYSYTDGDKVIRLVKSVQGYWVSQDAERFYPYGYGEDLELEKTGTAEYNNTLCDVYTAVYKVDIGETVNKQVGEEAIKEPLTAIITQEYYVDPDADQVLCLITDVTDMNSKQQISVLMLNEGLTAEEAEKQYGSAETAIEKLEILSYNDSLTIDIPSVETIN